MTNETEGLLEEAERLSDAATPGPWCQNHYGVNNWPGPDAPTRIMELLHNQDDDEEQNYRDAEFIARARTMVPELAAALRRAETDRDAALKQSAAWEIQAQDMRDRLIKAEAERDAQHDLVLRLTAERDELEELARRRLYRLSEIGQLVGAKLGQSTERAVRGALAEARECASGQQRRADALQREMEALEQINARLTAERDEARRQSLERARVVLMLDEDLDEAQAQVWGLGCKVTNLREALKRNEKQRRELGWRAASEAATAAEVVHLRSQSLYWFEERESHSKQMRECLRQKYQLTQDNARLQQQVATQALLLRGGK